MSRIARLLGLDAGDLPSVRRLGAVVGAFALGDFVVEGAVTSAFLARIGAEHLPLALAGRAVVEVLASLAYGRAARSLSPRRALFVLAVGSATVLALLSALLGSTTGALAAFVLVSAIARVKVIHFGVLALAELPGGMAARTLPAVYACARLGAMLAGPLLAGLAAFGTWAAVLAGALAYAGGALGLAGVRRAEPEAPESVPFADEPVPSTLARPHDPSPASTLLAAILTGAVALAVGRLALSTQSGAILEAHFSEAELSRVLGLYFTAANALGLVLQLFVVGRVLRDDGLPWLNTSWSALYIAAQLVLAFGPPVVATALGARLVESELRNAARTPVANLLYEGLPEERRAWARTLVIGVSIPLATLAAGGALALSDKSHGVLSAVGVAAAIVLLLATLVQNRAWRAGLARK